MITKQADKSRRCIITGATGFVGANLLRRLLNDGHEVHAFVRAESDTGRIESLRDRLRFHTLDLADAEQTQRLVQEIEADWIFHLAAHGAYSWQDNTKQMIETNIICLVNLLQAAAEIGFDAFVNSGSSSEYGLKDHPAKEDEIVKPNSVYAVTKVAATHFCQYFAQCRRLYIPTLRLYSVYGPDEDEHRFVPTLVRYGLRGELPPLAQPNIARDYVYIDDVCDAYLLAATQKVSEFGPAYNIGTGRQTTISEAVATAKKLMPIRAEPKWGSMANRHWDTAISGGQ